MLDRPAVGEVRLVAGRMDVPSADAAGTDRVPGGGEAGRREPADAGRRQRFRRRDANVGAARVDRIRVPAERTSALRKQHRPAISELVFSKNFSFIITDQF